MKKQLELLLSLLLTAAPFLLPAQETSSEERLGLPGDQLNLAAVLDIFRSSTTLESFEAALNADSSKVNNLDLNTDNRVDYIRVTDHVEGSMHTIVLQSDINEMEKQDIAVIYVEKKEGKVTVQIVGDEDLYGKEYIIEPSYDSRGTYTPNPAYQNDKGQTTTVINNYYYDSDADAFRDRPSYCPPPTDWIIVSFMFGPLYRPWVSPWYWSYYPGWWSPWTPWYWDSYYYHWYYQHNWYGWWYWRTPHPRFQYWYGPYRNIRKSSNTIINNRNSGRYESYYQNPRPEKRPAVKAISPSHNLNIDRNPAVIRQKVSDQDMRPVPVKPGEVRPQKEQAEPGKTGREPAKTDRKDGAENRQEPVREKPERKKWFNRNPSRVREQQIQRNQQQPRKTAPVKTAPEPRKQPEKAQPGNRPGGR